MSQINLFYKSKMYPFYIIFITVELASLENHRTDLLIDLKTRNFMYEFRILIFTLINFCQKSIYSNFNR